MSYTITYSGRAEKDLRKHSRETQDRLLEQIEKLAQEPLPRGARKLRGYKEAYYRVRVGSYRIVYEIDHEAERIGVVSVDKRGRVYDR